MAWGARRAAPHALLVLAWLGLLLVANGSDQHAIAGGEVGSPRESLAVAHRAEFSRRSAAVLQDAGQVVERLGVEEGSAGNGEQNHKPPLVSRRWPKTSHPRGSAAHHPGLIRVRAEG